jgi:hypothetical protein
MQRGVSSLHCAHTEAVLIALWDYLEGADRFGRSATQDFQWTINAAMRAVF